MKGKKQHIGTISGMDLIKNRKGKVNKSQPIVHSGTGYQKSDKHYNRKNKKNQQLKAKLKNYGFEKAGFLLYRYVVIR
jgi:hypothetical protein